MAIIVNIVKFVLAFTSGVYGTLSLAFWSVGAPYVTFVLQCVAAGVLYFVWDRINDALVRWCS